MADTIRRWECGCGSFRFRVAGVDMRVCQDCKKITKLTAGLWWWAGYEHGKEAMK